MAQEQKEEQRLQSQAPDKGWFTGYKGGEEMPLAGYATLLGIYNAAFAAILLAAKSGGHKPPEPIGDDDPLLPCVATRKLGRLIAKEPLTRPLRAPLPA